MSYACDTLSMMQHVSTENGIVIALRYLTLRCQFLFHEYSKDKNTL